MKIIPDTTGFLAVYKVKENNEENYISLPIIGWVYHEDLAIPAQALVPSTDGTAIPCTQFRGLDGELEFDCLMPYACDHEEDESWDK